MNMDELKKGLEKAGLIDYGEKNHHLSVLMANFLKISSFLETNDGKFFIKNYKEFKETREVQLKLKNNLELGIDSLVKGADFTTNQLLLSHSNNLIAKFEKRLKTCLK